MTKAMTLALAFYVGATAAFLLPFASPLYGPLSALAALIGGY